MSNCFEVTSKFGNICSFKSDSVNKGDKVYTSPQTKPLSNDDIIQIACDSFCGLINKEERHHFIRFAKAIEERHGIK